MSSNFVFQPRGTIITTLIYEVYEKSRKFSKMNCVGYYKVETFRSQM